MEKCVGMLFLLKDLGNEHFYIKKKKTPAAVSWSIFTPVTEALIHRELMVILT